MICWYISKKGFIEQSHVQDSQIDHMVWNGHVGGDEVAESLKELAAKPCILNKNISFQLFLCIF